MLKSVRHAKILEIISHKEMIEQIEKLAHGRFEK